MNKHLQKIVIEYLLCDKCNKLHEEFEDEIYFDMAILIQTCDNGRFVKFKLIDEDFESFEALIKIDKLRRKYNLNGLVIEFDNKYNSIIKLENKKNNRVELPERLKWDWDGFSYGCVDIHINKNDEWSRLIANWEEHQFINFYLYDLCKNTPKFNFTRHKFGFTKQNY